MLTLRYVLCDVFTDRPLSGNALAVFTDASRLNARTMQSIAREMNLSETVFVLRPERGGQARIRIFTPTRELPFAGHPTLGAAFVLGGPLQRSELQLETGAGIIPVSLEREGPRIVFGWMTLPVPNVATFDAHAALFAALGVPGSSLPVEIYDLGPRHVFVMLDSAEAVAAVKPDFAALARLTDAGFNVFAGSGKRYKTRMFAPGHGVLEDAATGSAAGPLGLHLVRHGRVVYGDELEIEQGAEIGRPSRLFARIDGSANHVERIQVGGAAVVIGRGEIKVPQEPEE